jgi:hypothetical protein
MEKPMGAGEKTGKIDQLGNGWSDARHDGGAGHLR